MDILIYGLACSLAANAFFWVRRWPPFILLLIPVILLVNLLPGRPWGQIRNKRLRLCWHGVRCLMSFALSMAVSVAFHLFLACRLLPGDWKTLLYSGLWCLAVELLLFWNGDISIYLTSVRLGIGLRVWAALTGWIPVFNIYVLWKLISTCRDEVLFETEKELLNEGRRPKQICRTKYPILMVHGVFARDFRAFNYWGRIPGELTQNGAQVYFGNHQSAASVADSAKELTCRIREIMEMTGAEKVNIIAHSKGGLDCRYAIAHGAAPYVASLTTINTPHRGCGYADYLLNHIPMKLQRKIEDTYNCAASAIGDQAPDFMAAVNDLTEEGCRAFSDTLTPFDGIYCRSVGTLQKRASGGRFPMNLTHRLVHFFHGDNDGMVAADSFPWGKEYQYLCPAKNRGISHLDIIDMNRDIIPGFDVREFYVGLVSDLKEKGL